MARNLPLTLATFREQGVTAVFKVLEAKNGHILVFSGRPLNPREVDIVGHFLPKNSNVEYLVKVRDNMVKMGKAKEIR